MTRTLEKSICFSSALARLRELGTNEAVDRRERNDSRRNRREATGSGVSGVEKGMMRGDGLRALAPL
jgi:hypothetical protein